MQKQIVDFSKTQQFSSLFLDYIQQNEAIKAFQNYSPDLQGIGKALEARVFDFQKRKTLVSELQAQYQGINTSPKTQINIEALLQENTFTVTCGHQLNLFTGPLYFIYKIITTLKLAEQLKKEFPKYNFVPVYWMASEDHDFAEINHFTLFGKTHTWEYDNAQGAVGKLSCTSLQALLESLPPETKPFVDFYRNADTLAEATAQLVNHLFGAQGLLILNPDVKLLRAEFSKHFIKELTERQSHNILLKQSKLLEQLGHKAQVSGRNINLMYADTGLRERIVYEDQQYKVLNTDLKFDEEAMLALVQKHPEKLSTNVILRPVYQEVILPNIAFIGGPAEVTYWLQLKEVFGYFGEQMPVVLPRNFALILNQSQAQKLEKAQLSTQDILSDENELKQLVTAKDLSLDYTDATETLEKLGQILKQKALLVDKSLGATVAAEHSKMQKIMDELQKRIHKALERRNTETITQVMNIKQKLFPEGSPQERVDNFLNFYLNDPQFIQHLYEVFEPLEFQYYLITK